MQGTYSSEDLVAFETIVKGFQTLQNSPSVNSLTTSEIQVLENFLRKFQASQPKKKRLIQRIRDFKQLGLSKGFKRIGQKIKNIKHKRKKFYLVLGVSVFLISVWYGVNSFLFLLKKLKFETQRNATLVQQLEEIWTFRTFQMAGSFIAGMVYMRHIILGVLESIILNNGLIR